jgi:hypothetical protein
MQKERRIRILRRFVIGLAVAALVAPAAQARVDELGGGAGSIAGEAVIHGENKGEYPDAFGDSTVVIHGENKGEYPDAFGDSTVVIHGENKGEYPALGDSTGPVFVPKPQTTPVGGLNSPSTFDWGDALVGAGAAFGLMLLAGGAALGVRRRQRPAAA